MKFNLSLFEGTDSIKFGMTKEEVQSILKIEPTLFKKSQFDKYDTEDYKGICHVFYEMGQDDKLVCSAIEFFGDSQVFLKGIQLIGEKREEIEGLFKREFEDCVSDEYGVTSQNYDVGFFSPNERLESVYIARKGYTKEQKEYYKKALDEKYSISKEPVEEEGTNIRKRLCPSCMDIKAVEEGTKCSKCNVLMI